MTNQIQPTIGRIVLYCVNAEQAGEINRRRTSGHSISERIKTALWPVGAQAHIGNDVKEGDTFPAIIIRVWGPECVNLQVLLDGNDTYWGLSRNYSETSEEGRWSWPPRA